MTARFERDWKVLLIAGAMVVSAEALSCEVGEWDMSRHVTEQRVVYADTGDAIGIVRLSSDGRWEAIVLGLGALNDSFSSLGQATDAVCQSESR